MKIKFRLRTKNLIEASWCIFCTSCSPLKKLWPLFISFISVFSLLGVFSAWSGGVDSGLLFWKFIQPLATMFLLFSVFAIAKFVMMFWRVKKMLYNEDSVIVVEDGKLKSIGSAGYFQIPCKEVNTISMHWTIVLKYRNVNGLLEFRFVDKGAFADKDQQTSFLMMLQEKTEIQETTEKQEGDFCFRIRGSVNYFAEADYHSFLVRRHIYGIFRWKYLAIMSIAVLFFTLHGYVVMHRQPINLVMGVFIFIGLFLMMGSRQKLDAVKKNLLKRMTQDEISDVFLMFCEDGILIKNHGSESYCNWKPYKYMVKTEKYLHLITAQKYIGDITIPLGAFTDDEASNRFVSYCKVRGLEYRELSSAHLIERGHMQTSAGLAIICATVFLFIGCTFFRNMEDEMNQLIDETGILSTRSVDAQWNPDDYESYIPLEQQIMVLKELGIPVSDQIAKEIRQWMEDYPDAREWVEGYPYFSLLSTVGMPDFAGDTFEQLPSSDKVYWFDFEGMDVEGDYINILKGVESIGNGELKFNEIATDSSEVDWEEGTGTLLVTYKLNGTVYEFLAKFYYDWLDPAFINHINEALQSEGTEKRLYAMGDNGQGCVLFYNDNDWADLFYQKTGCLLYSETEHME